MSKELVIGSNRHETKVAILEEDQLVEIYFQRGNEYSLAGSIHKGRVTRVLPGMQSAFVDLGLERDTFLYVSDFFEEHDDIDTVGDEPKPERRSDDRRNDGRRERGDRGRQVGQERRPAAAISASVVEMRPEPVLLAEEDELPVTLLEDELEEPVLLTGSDVPGPDSESEPILFGPTGIPVTSEQHDEARIAGDRDRRPRRSRRRRNRGSRGIPDNKYAQPGDVSSPASQPLRSYSKAEPDDEDPAAPFITEPAEDVVILPGESLAKYRQQPPSAAPSKRVEQPRREQLPANLPVPSQSTSESSWTTVTLRPPIAVTELQRLSEPQRQPEPQHSPEPEPITAEASPVDASESSEPVAEQAVDLIFADRVFAHHTDEETPELDSLEASSTEPPHDLVVEPPHIDSPEPALEHTFAAPFEPVANVETVLAHEDIHQEDVHHHDEPETLARFEPNAASFEFPPSPEHEEHHRADEELEALESSGLAGDADEDAPGDDEPGEQSATLRESSNTRPLQRSSRRMRRRRGGNRFANGGGSSLEAAPKLVGSGTGVAPALETQEIRPDRERPDRERPERGAQIERSERPERDRTERPMPSISDLLKPGQEIIVQIAKEPLGQKGARITSHVALPGRFVVFMPSVNHLGVSRKIASDEERQRLKRILQTHRTGAAGGFIVRTAGEGVPEDEIAADMNFLYSQWLDIRQKAEKKPAPALLHYDLDIVQRILRDQVTDDFKAIWVDSEDMYENILTFMQRFQPALVNRVKMYTRQAPIFDAFNITAELEKALRPKVWLKSGGYIVINQTEALVAIDINTGKYVGKSNRLEDTIVKTNTEAVKEIVRQIRLRDLGGIIVVDFIDMDERKNRQKVMQALEEAMGADKAPYKILQFNDFGLVAITRKRVKQSLERTLCAPCPYCEGAGYVKSVQTVIGEILVEAQKLAKAIEGKDVLLRVHPDVAKVLKASTNKYLDELEEILGRPVLVKGDPTLHNEKFDLG